VGLKIGRPLTLSVLRSPPSSGRGRVASSVTTTTCDGVLKNSPPKKAPPKKEVALSL